MPTRIQTSRLLLREWQDADLEPFARINADPEVMRFFPEPMSRDASDRLVARIREHFAEHNYGLWAVQVIADDAGEPTPSENTCIGFIGLSTAAFQAHFTPAVEIGWRLAREAQGLGYATEGARAVLTYAFESLALPEVVSFTSVYNLTSRRVMEKIGLIHTPTGDFDHPALPVGHRLRRHVLYRLRNPNLPDPAA